MQETRVKGGSTRAEHFRQLPIRQTPPLPPINERITDQETTQGVYRGINGISR